MQPRRARSKRESAAVGEWLVVRPPQRGRSGSRARGGPRAGGHRKVELAEIEDEVLCHLGHSRAMGEGVPRRDDRGGVRAVQRCVNKTHATPCRLQPSPRSLSDTVGRSCSGAVCVREPSAPHGPHRVRPIGGPACRAWSLEPSSSREPPRPSPAPAPSTDAVLSTGWPPWGSWWRRASQVQAVGVTCS
jgi:hypothetical protein